MRQPPRRILIAILAVAALALLGLLGAVATVQIHVTARIIMLAPQLYVLVLLARRFPLQLAPKTKTAVTTAPNFASALLLPLPLAMLLTALATLPAELTVRSPSTGRKPPWFQVVFNTAGNMLVVGIGGLLFNLLSNSPTLDDVSIGAWLYAAPAAALAMYSFNLVLIDLIVGLQIGHPPLREFWRRWRFTLPQESAMLLIGLLVATVAARLPLAVGLMGVPSYVIYRSMRDGIALQVQTRDALLELADIIDMRDHYTSEHSRRVAELARLTAAKLHMPSDLVETIYMAGRVHDVGKIGIKSTVLMKPSRLTDREFAEMKSHPELGAKLVARFPQFASGKELVLSHHERYDGKGYPRGLAGQAIPSGARVLAVADAWDAMTSHRSYRQALDMDRVYVELERCRGTQFDPAVLDAFLAVLKEHPELAVPITLETQDVDSFEEAAQATAAAVA
jgi:HD-GYP domain-containing protein (c-di-GMP phosphodiesterase class II)